MNVRRRGFVVAMGVLVTPALARAQSVPGRTARLGILVSETTVGQAGRIDALRAGLAERGYVEGRNIVIVLRSAESNYDRLPRLAAELANSNVDVIVAFGIKALAAARGATATVPIVIPATSGDLVALGFARTLARPGGNVTGSTTFGSEVMTERLELVREVRPGAMRVGVLVNPANAGTAATLGQMESSARASKLALRRFDVRSRADFADVLAASSKAKMDGVILQDDTLFGEANAAELAGLSAKHGLVGIGGLDYADAGGAIGYGRVDADLYRRGAYFVDRILNGAKPGELPIEQASRFVLVVNLKATRALGLSLPQPVLLRADRVID